MTELHDLLERSVDAPAPRDVGADVAADLRRGRRALGRHRRHTWLAGALGLAVVATGATAYQQLAGGALVPLAPADGSSKATAPTSSVTTATAAAARLFSAGDLARGVTVRPIGPHESRYYVGPGRAGVGDRTFARLQVVDDGPAAGTRTVTYHGRTYYRSTDASGATVLMVRDSHGPWLRMTTPKEMGWSLDLQLRILASSGTVVP